MASQSALIDRLSSLSSLITQICDISGTAGVSVGITHRGQKIYTHNSGFRDAEKAQKPDSDTIYNVGSLSKGMTAAAVGLLVEDGKFTWETPIKDLLLGYRQRNETIAPLITVTDLLAHRTGLNSPAALWSQGENKGYLPRTEILPIFSSAPSVQEFRASFKYCNYAYWVVDEIIQQQTGQSWGTLLNDRLIEPLHLNRTFVKATPPSTTNIAKPYMPLMDGSFVEIPFPDCADGSAIAAAGGVRSSVNDLLKYYNALLNARASEFGDKRAHDSHVLRQASVLTSAKNLMDPKGILERSYGLGLARTMLPGKFGDIGKNMPLVASMPVLGLGDTAKLVIWHQGSMPGFLSSTFLVPEEEIAIVVLTNSLSFNDAADWIGQLLLEHALGMTATTDFIKLARDSKAASIRQFTELDKEFEQKRAPHPELLPLKAYVGDYWNPLHNFLIRVFEEGGSLRMCFQGDASDTYILKGFEKDTFSWNMPYDEQAKRGRWPGGPMEYFLFRFQATEPGRVTKLLWNIDPSTGGKEDQVFAKDVIGKMGLQQSNGDSSSYTNWRPNI
jgi:CubicO group peptidase (beta-lactamase class C family)